VTLFNGSLPTTSPYSSQADPYKSFWRIKVPLANFNNYDIWKLKNSIDEQVHLILTKGDECRYIENAKDIERLNKANNEYLCFNNGQWKSFDFCERGRVVNFLIFEDFQLNFCTENCDVNCGEHCKRDKVRRMDSIKAFILDIENLLLKLIIKTGRFEDQEVFRELLDRAIYSKDKESLDRLLDYWIEYVPKRAIVG
jgi:hypothetical protein